MSSQDLDSASRPAAAGRSTCRRHLFRLVALAFASVFALIMLEVASYVYLRAARGYDGEHLMTYQFDPYKNIRLTPHYEDTRGIRHNAQGFRRDADTPRTKSEDTLRVFVMGGSTAYGLGSLSRYGIQEYEVIPNDETIDHYLERALEGAIPGKRIEVINAAITSFYSHHHLIYLNQTILKYDPDLIIFLDGFNDYYPTDEGFDQFNDYAYQERAHVFLGEPTVFAWSYYTGWWLARKSHFFHLLGRGVRNIPAVLRGGRERLVIDVDTAMANLEENVQENWVKMVERNSLILEHEGVDAIFALQPEIAFDQAKSFGPLEQQIYDEMVTHWPLGYIEFKNKARPLVLRHLEEAAAVGNARTIDLTDIYGGVTEDAYTDYCHLTGVGNRVLAETLAPLVIEMLEERVASMQPAPTSS